MTETYREPQYYRDLAREHHLKMFRDLLEEIETFNMTGDEDLDAELLGGITDCTTRLSWWSSEERKALEEAMLRMEARNDLGPKEPPPKETWVVTQVYNGVHGVREEWVETFSSREEAEKFRSRVHDHGACIWTGPTKQE